MMKDFQADTYIVDENIADTMSWLLQHQDCFDELHFDVQQQELKVTHVAGVDQIRAGMYLTAKYGILVTS
ncbi:hypothetical protein [Acinetobacter brisouii]|uniref:hypothetical protein n=1 Tax=Acinetobacter brisouii TaxID=396323 RepID=UPI0005F84902|nr:hypothetical protein [Acinetobacter brisouii]KJV39018.1 hypothetical protein VH98_06970 [Acinetobacter brisouii]